MEEFYVFFVGYIYKYMYINICTLSFQVICSIRFFNASDDLRNRFSNLDSFFVLSGGKKLFLPLSGTKFTCTCFCQVTRTGH